MNDPYNQGLPKLAQPGLEIPNRIKDRYSKGSPKLPQRGPEVANSPNECYNICMTSTCKLVLVVYLWNPYSQKK